MEDMRIPPATRRTMAESVAAAAAAGLKFPGMPRQKLPPLGFFPATSRLPPDDQLTGEAEEDCQEWVWPTEDFQVDVMEGETSFTMPQDMSSSWEEDSSTTLVAESRGANFLELEGCSALQNSLEPGESR